MQRIVSTLMVLGAATWFGAAAQGAHVSSSAEMDGSQNVLNGRSDVNWSYRAIEPVQLAEHCRYGSRYRHHGYYGRPHGGYHRYHHRRIYSPYPYGYRGYHGGHYYHRHRHYGHHRGGFGIHGSNASLWISF